MPRFTHWHSSCKLKAYSEAESALRRAKGNAVTPTQAAAAEHLLGVLPELVSGSREEVPLPHIHRNAGVSGVCILCALYNCATGDDFISQICPRARAEDGGAALDGDARKMPASFFSVS